MDTLRQQYEAEIKALRQERDAAVQALNREAEIKALRQERDAAVRALNRERDKIITKFVAFYDELKQAHERTVRLGSLLLLPDQAIRLRNPTMTAALPREELQSIIVRVLREMVLLVAPDVAANKKAATFLVPVGEDYFQVVAEVGLYGFTGMPVETQIKEQLTLQDSLAGYVYREQQPVTIEDIRQKPAHIPWVHTSGDEAFPGRAQVPAMLSGAGSGGVVCLDIAEPYTMFEEDLRLMLIVASKIAHTWALTEFDNSASSAL